MLIKQNQTISPLHEADSIIDKSVEISDCESNNSVNFIPLIATESGSHAIDISDILDFCEKENIPARTAIREICEYNNIDTVSFYVSESDYIESDELKHIANLLQESGEDVYKVPVSDNNPIYICANEAIDELAYNGDGSLLESFMEDDYVPFSASIYDSIINEAGHKRGGNINKARKLVNKAKASTETAPNGSDGQRQEPSANPPQQNDGQQQKQPNTNSSAQPTSNTNSGQSQSNSSNQTQTQNTTRQQQQQKQPNANSSAQPTSNNNQSQPNSNNKQQNQNTTQQQQQKQPNTNSSQPASNNNQSQPNSNGQPQQNDDQQDQQKEKQVESTINNIEKEAENKPAGFISSKIAALRKLYANWLAKKNQEHDQGKIGFFSNILRVITNCIDRLLAKLQGAKKAENDATANNNNSSAQQPNGNTQTTAKPATTNG